MTLDTIVLVMSTFQRNPDGTRVTDPSGNYIVKEKLTYKEGQFYTGVSRVRNISGLWILGFNAQSVIASKDAAAEMERMRSNQVQELTTPIILEHPRQALKIIYINNKLKLV